MLMNNDFSPDLISLLDENNQEHNFEILDTIEEDGSKFYALMPVYDSGEDMLSDSGEYTILESIIEDGEEQLAEVENRELRMRLSRIFEERFNDMFYED